MNQPLGVDVDLFEDFLEERWHEDAKCESVDHVFSCSVSAVSRRITRCGARNNLWCLSRTIEYNIDVERNTVICYYCDSPISECWVVTPA